MARWLVKNEPDCFSFADLLRDGETTWDGVKNPQARKYLSQMAAGDEVLYYHTGKDKCVVGVAVVSQAAAGDEPVRLKPKRPLKVPVSLASIKADERFADWQLVRQAQLSVMPVPDELWKAVIGMAS